VLTVRMGLIKGSLRPAAPISFVGPFFSRGGAGLVGTTAALTGLPVAITFFVAADFGVVALAAAFFVFGAPATFWLFGAAADFLVAGPAAAFCPGATALPLLTGCAAAPVFAVAFAGSAFAGTAGAVPGPCVLVAGIADFVDAVFAPAAGVTAPVFTPGAVFVVAEAFFAGADLVDADWFAVVADGAAGCPLALAGLAALAGDGVAFACESPLSLCPIAAVASIVTIAKIFISFIVVPFTSSVRSTSPPAKLLEAVPAWPLLAPPVRPHD
jgi:hypothetical protein